MFICLFVYLFIFLYHPPMGRILQNLATVLSKSNSLVYISKMIWRN